MKECPNCGSVLADNEPYCENCGFDPGFDGGGWNHGKPRTYTSGKPEEFQPSSIEEGIGCFFLIVAIMFGILAFWAYFF